MFGIKEKARRFIRSVGGHGRTRKVVGLGALSTAAIMTQPHLALGLPGHRALGWLTLLFLMRLIGGTGWATGIGLASAVGTLAIGRSPNGVWGVLQYVIAGGLVDLALHLRPALARKATRLAGLGALVLVLVGWITPLSHSFTGGVGTQGIWLSLTEVSAAAWFRLLSFDVAFGTGAGLLGWTLASVTLSLKWLKPRSASLSVGTQAL